MAKNMNTYRLYFGRDSVSHGPITHMQFARFLTEFVDTVFDAYTLIASSGVWKGKSEPCTILELVVSSEQLPAIEHIAAEYARSFSQDCVLLTASPCQFQLIESTGV